MVYAAAVPRLPSIVALLLIGSLAATGSVAAEGSTRVNVKEKCSYKLLADQGVVLTTTFVLSTARGGRPSSIRILPGWNIGRLYPKAETALRVRLRPGQTVRRAVARRIPRAPRLWQQLRTDGVNCASTLSLEIP